MQAEKEKLERKEAELKTLTDERVKFIEKIKIRSREIEQAWDSYLEGNDNSKPKAKARVEELKEKQEEDSQRLKKLDRKIEEAKAEVEKARSVLKGAERAFEERLAESVRQDEQTRRVEFTKSLPARRQKIISHYLGACNEISEILIEGTFIENGKGSLSQDAGDFLRNLGGELRNAEETKGYRRHNAAPWSDSLILLPFASPLVEGFIAGDGLLQAGDVTVNRHLNRVNKLRKELEK